MLQIRTDNCTICSLYAHAPVNHWLPGFYSAIPPSSANSAIAPLWKGVVEKKNDGYDVEAGVIRRRETRTIKLLSIANFNSIALDNILEDNVNNNSMTAAILLETTEATLPPSEASHRQTNEEDDERYCSFTQIRSRNSDIIVWVK